MEGSSLDGWLTSNDLLQYATGRGFELSRRQLETLRSQGLINRPERRAQAGRHPVWASPPGTDDQLVKLLRLRRRTADPDVLRVLSWLDGADQKADAVRHSLLRIIDNGRTLIDKEVAVFAKRASVVGEPAEVRREGLLQLAAQVANARSKTPLVRLRSADGYRVRGVQAILYTVVTGEAPDSSIGTGEDVERALGVLPRATHDQVNAKTFGVHTTSANPWHDGQPLDLSNLARICSLPALRAAVERCSSDDLQYARQAVMPLLTAFRWIADITGSLHGDFNFMGLELFRSRSRRLAEVEYALSVALMVSLMQSDLRDNLRQLVDAAQGFTGEFRKLQNLLLGPRQFVEERVAMLPPASERLLNAARSVVAPARRQL